MSHWTTSGRDRLRAAQQSSFAQRAQMRANVVAPEAMVLPTNHYPSRHQAAPIQPPSTNRRSVGTKAKYSYGNPIARRGKVVQLGASRVAARRQHHATPPPPMQQQHPSYGHPQTRRIRDPMAARYHHSPRMVPHGQQLVQPHHPSYVGTRSAVLFQPSPHQPQIIDYQAGPNPMARRIYPNVQTSPMAPPPSISHLYAPQEDFAHEQESLQQEGEGRWGDDSSSVAMRMHSGVRATPLQQRFQREQMHIPVRSPPGFQRFRKQARAADFFDPMELPWEEETGPDQTLDDTWSHADNRTFGPATYPSTPSGSSMTRNQTGPFARSRLRGPLHGHPEENPGIEAPPVSAPPNRSFSSAVKQNNVLEYMDSNPLTSKSHRQRSNAANDWDAVAAVHSTPRNRPLAAFTTAEPFPVDQDGSMSADWENMGDDNNAGISRFQQPAQENEAVTDQRIRYLRPNSRPPTVARPRDDLPNHSQQPRQRDCDLGMPPPLRFFNEGVEIDIHGRPLSRPGSPVGPNSKIPAANNALDTGGFPHDDDSSWNEFF